MSTERDDAAAKDELKIDELQPILPGTAGSDYENYLRTDELLSLQKTPAEMVHRDERLFQTVHQSSELWLKLACFEIDEAIAQLGQDEIRRALRLLGRADHCIVIVTEALHMLERLSPWEYHEVRKALGHGSGFDSPGFREFRARAPRLWAAFEETRERSGLSLAGHVRPRRGADRARRADIDLARRAREDGAARDRGRRDRHAGHPGGGARRAHQEPPLPRALGRAEHAHRDRRRVTSGPH
jgi:tryptophan 2,3-dioxygenase